MVELRMGWLQRVGPGGGVAIPDAIRGEGSRTVRPLGIFIAEVTDLVCACRKVVSVRANLLAHR